MKDYRGTASERYVQQQALLNNRRFRTLISGGGGNGSSSSSRRMTINRNAAAAAATSLLTINTKTAAISTNDGDAIFTPVPDFYRITLQRRRDRLERNRSIPTAISSLALGRVSNMPNAHCGYSFCSLPRAPMTCNVRVDPRAVVSLSMHDRYEKYLREFATKLPLMCINVSRLTFTTEAFAYVNRTRDTVQEALRFYVNTDIRMIDSERMYRVKNKLTKCSDDSDITDSCNIGNAAAENDNDDDDDDDDDDEFTVPLPPFRNDSFTKLSINNKRFSDLLHLLRSSGYEQYMFELANELHLNVDLIKVNNLVYRYTRKESSGVLTCIYNEHNWYVRTTAEPYIDVDIVSDILQRYKSNRAESSSSCM